MAVLLVRNASLSTMLTVTADFPSVAPLALLRFKIRFSCASAVVSFVMGMEMVAEVSPAAMVSVPEVLVKSLEVVVPLDV